MIIDNCKLLFSEVVQVKVKSILKCEIMSAFETSPELKFSRTVENKNTAQKVPHVLTITYNYIDMQISVIFKSDCYSSFKFPTF